MFLRRQQPVRKPPVIGKMQKSFRIFIKPPNGNKPSLFLSLIRSSTVVSWQSLEQIPPLQVYSA